jgi:hypothetical protein
LGTRAQCLASGLEPGARLALLRNTIANRGHSRAIPENGDVGQTGISRHPSRSGAVCQVARIAFAFSVHVHVTGDYTSTRALLTCLAMNDQVGFPVWLLGRS